MANIKFLLDKIKTAVYGIDVRDTIHDAIKQTYLDAIDANNSSMEVANARGSYSSLNERLNNLSNTINNNLTLQTVEAAVPNISLLDNTFFECSTIQGINFSIGAVDVNFNCFVSFETQDIQSVIAIDNIRFTGDNTSGGSLILNANTSYFIEFKYLRQGYLAAEVRCYEEGDSGATVDPGEDSNNNVLQDFSGAEDLVNLAMTYFNVRSTYLTYGQTNILTSNGSKSWSEITTTGADSPDGRYRHLDCSALIGLIARGISFSEVLLNQSTYNNKDLSPRTSLYSWAVALPRTAAEQLKYIEDNGWSLPQSQWHTDEAKSNWAGLKRGDLYFLGGSNNGRYKGVYHVGLFIGDYVASDGTHKICILDCSSNQDISKHTDNKTKAVRILQFSKIAQNDIVGIARIQA